MRARSLIDAENLSDYTDAKLRLTDVMEDSPVMSQLQGKKSSVSFVTDRKYHKTDTTDNLFALDDNISLSERLSSEAPSKEYRMPERPARSV